MLAWRRSRSRSADPKLSLSHGGQAPGHDVQRRGAQRTQRVYLGLLSDLSGFCGDRCLEMEGLCPQVLRVKAVIRPTTTQMDGGQVESFRCRQASTSSRTVPSGDRRSGRGPRIGHRDWSAPSSTRRSAGLAGRSRCPRNRRRSSVSPGDCDERPTRAAFRMKACVSRLYTVIDQYCVIGTCAGTFKR